MSPVGRPTKYNAEILKKAQEYVQRCQKEKQTPFVEELALILDVNDDTIVEWTGKHDAFSATVKQLKMLQRMHLKKGALEKRYQPSIAIFLLKVNHGLDEKQPEISVKHEPLRIEFVSAVPDMQHHKRTNEKQTETAK